MKKLKRMMLPCFVAMVIMSVLLCGCQTEPAVSSSAPETSQVVGGGDGDLCEVHHILYHDVDKSFLSHISEEQLYQRFFNKYSAEDQNIINLVQEFNITEEQLKQILGITEENIDKLVDEYLPDGLTNRAFLDAIYRYDPDKPDAAFLRSSTSQVVGGGDGDMCTKHHVIYHNIPGEVYDLVDKEQRETYFEKYNRSEEMTIVHFVEEFGISEEAFKRARGITDETMDKLAEEGLPDGLTNRAFLDAIYRYDPDKPDAAFLRSSTTAAPSTTAAATTTVPTAAKTTAKK